MKEIFEIEPFVGYLGDGVVRISIVARERPDQLEMSTPEIVGWNVPLLVDAVEPFELVGREVDEQMAKARAGQQD